MAFVSSLLPSRLQQFFETERGKRFARFLLVAVVSVAATQIVLGALVFEKVWTPGVEGVVAAVTGALVSYLMSRWAWERKGRPDLLRETLPFWVVSLAVWLILGLTTHYSAAWAHSLGWDGLKRVLLVQGCYFAANCCTFVGRFVFFHYVVFANRKPVMPAAETAVAGD